MNVSCLAAKIKPLQMVKPVDTCWNSKLHMISHAIYLKPAIDICTKSSIVAQYQTHPLNFRQKEWVILEELSPLLGVCPFLCICVPCF